MYDHRRSGIISGDGKTHRQSMTEMAWRMTLETQSRTKRHKWVIKSPKLTEEFGKVRKTESVSH